jgi:ribosomal protein S18 acetylase RimI-like enzyme
VDETPAARLIPVTNSEYAEFCAEQVVEYARQLTLAGEGTAENCIAISRERLQDLLTDRLRKADHDFFVATAIRGGSKVGWVWLSPPPDFLGAGHEHTRWLSQLTVDEPYRGRGWGRAILLAAEQQLTASGIQQIWLRVFDWNLAARRLYASQGYELARQFATDAHLRKILPKQIRPTTVCS